MKLIIAIICAIALTGCSINQAADRATYEAIAPEYVEYVQQDPTLTEQQRDRRLRTVETWRVRVGVGTEDGE